MELLKPVYLYPMYLIKSLLCIIFISTLASCHNYDDYLYEVTSMEASNADNSGEFPQDASADSVPAKAFAIKLKYIMIPKGGTGNDLDSHESGWVNEDQLISMNIYALNDFDSNHIAGILLNDYFMISPGGTIQNKIKSGSIGNGNNLETNAVSWNSFEYLMLMVNPQVLDTFSFVVDVGLSDNRHLVDTTTVILY